jgi:hypothetical protein
VDDLCYTLVIETLQIRKLTPLKSLIDKHGGQIITSSDGDTLVLAGKKWKK